jgi:hypothetical protein
MPAHLIEWKAESPSKKIKTANEQALCFYRNICCATHSKYVNIVTPMMSNVCRATVVYIQISHRYKRFKKCIFKLHLADD